MRDAERRMSHLFTKAGRKGNQRRRKDAERSEEIETTITDRMTYDNDYNYFCDNINKVDIRSASKCAEKWRPTAHLFSKGQPLITSPPDSCMAAHQSAWPHH